MKANKYSGNDPLMICGDAMSLRALKRCYLKHQKDDPSIGWEELGDELCDVIAQIMGDDEFVEWNETEVDKYAARRANEI